MISREQVQSKDFSLLLPKDRLDHLREAVRGICDRAHGTCPEFALLAYGSVVYGFNGSCYGNLDDLDLLAVAYGGIDSGNFFQQLSAITSSNIDQRSEVEINIQRFNRGEINIFRVSGKCNGEIPFGVHVYDFDTLRRAPRPMDVGMQTISIVPNKPKYYDEYEDWKLNGELVWCNPDIHPITASGGTFAYSTAYFSRRIGGIPTVSKRARKFLTSDILYDPQQKVDRVLTNLWRSFVRTALYYNPGITDEGIMEFLVRQNRFSVEYRTRVLEKVAFERALLQERLSRKDGG